MKANLLFLFVIALLISSSVLVIQIYIFQQDGWSCESSESRKKFEDLCLDEDFFDYDDEANCPIGISEIETKIE